MAIYQFELTGITPAIMNADDIEATDMLKAFRESPAFKKQSVPGDDRSPAWSWQTKIYTGDGRLVLPADNLMACLLKSGSSVPLKGQTTCKSLTQSGMAMCDEHLEFEGAEGPIFLKDILVLKDLPFAEQAKRAQNLGFRLFVKRCKPPGSKSKHVRVRPRFDEWTVRGKFEVFDAMLTVQRLHDLFETAGSRIGLMDWRPGAKDSPGPYGRFSTKLTPVKK